MPFLLYALGGSALGASVYSYLVGSAGAGAAVTTGVGYTAQGLGYAAGSMISGLLAGFSAGLGITIGPTFLYGVVGTVLVYKLLCKVLVDRPKLKIEEEKLAVDREYLKIKKEEIEILKIEKNKDSIKTKSYDDKQDSTDTDSSNNLSTKHHDHKDENKANLVDLFSDSEAVTAVPSIDLRDDAPPAEKGHIHDGQFKHLN